MNQRQYWVYILANKSNKTIYVGVTSDLARRVHQHKQGKGSKFTSKYHINKLVYFETCSSPTAAILREKQIKAGSRKNKNMLVEGFNPNWTDLWSQIIS